MSHRALCSELKRVKKCRMDTDIPITQDFDFAEALESIYPLLDIIFSYLNYRELKRVCLVKKSWQTVAEKILNKRNNISWIKVSRSLRRHYIECNHWYNNTNLGIIVYNCEEVKNSDFICIEQDTNLKKITVTDFLKSYVVPIRTKFCLIGYTYVAPSYSQENYNVPFFDGIFIPAIPNVRTSIFYCTAIDIRWNYVKFNEKLKCLMLFSVQDLEYSIYDMLELLLISDTEYESVAIGGGIIKNFKGPSCKIDKKGQGHTLCIAFCEEKYCESIFDASSVVITDQNASSHGFENELLKFKSRIIIREKSMAFKICCCATDISYDETAIFNKVFPKTPLLALNAEKEIGWDCFNIIDVDEYEQQKSEKLEKTQPVMQRRRSTVIVFITWGQVVHQGFVQVRSQKRRRKK